MWVSSDPCRLVMRHGLAVFDLHPYNIVHIQQGAVIREIASALERGDILEQDLYRHRVVFSSLCEGHGPREQQAVITSIQDQPWYDPLRVVFLNNVFDLPGPGVKSVSWPWYMVDHSNWFEWYRSNVDPVTKKSWVLCLARRISYLRSHLVAEVMARFSEPDRCVSYASMIDFSHFDQVIGQQLPILIDGPTFGNEQHQARDPRIMGCMFNVIAETSNQEPEDRYVWDSYFVTEKTFKCLAWRQIPCWYSVPGLVGQIRSLGFDMFDDVMSGHDYDAISDPMHRLQRLMQVLEQAVDHHRALGPERTAEIYEPRLDHNYQVLERLHSQRLPYWKEIIHRVSTV